MSDSPIIINDNDDLIRDNTENNITLKKPVQKLLSSGFSIINNYNYCNVELDAESIYYSIIENIRANESINKYVLVIADTHNSEHFIDVIIDVANRLGIKNILHAGDIVTDRTLTKFNQYRGKLSVTFGNHDKQIADKKQLNRI